MDSRTSPIPRSVLLQLQRFFRRVPRAAQIIDLYEGLYQVQRGEDPPPEGFYTAARQAFRDLTRALPRLLPPEAVEETEESILLMSVEAAPLLRRIDRGDRSPVLFGQVSSDLATGLGNVLRPLGVFVRPFRIPGAGSFIGLRSSSPPADVPEEIASVFTPAERALPKTARQPSQDLDALYNQAEEAMEQQLDLLNRGQGIDRMLGAKVIHVDPKRGLDLSHPGPLVLIGPLKGKARVLEKIRESGSDPSSILDLVRATVAVDNLGDIPRVMKMLRSMGIQIAREPKNRFAKPTDVGYRDLMFNVRYPNGHVGELQINVKSMLVAKELGHSYYEKVRSFMADKAIAGDTSVTPEEQAEIDRANAVQKHLYSEAWEDAVGSTASMLKNAAELRGARYYEYQDAPVVVEAGKVPMLLAQDGSRKPLYNIAKFYREATQVSLVEFKNLLSRGILRT